MRLCNRLTEEKDFIKINKHRKLQTNLFARLSEQSLPTFDGIDKIHTQTHSTVIWLGLLLTLYSFCCLNLPSFAVSGEAMTPYLQQSRGGTMSRKPFKPWLNKFSFVFDVVVKIIFPAKLPNVCGTRHKCSHLSR